MSESERTQRERNMLSQHSRRENIRAGSHRPTMYRGARTLTNVAQFSIRND